MVADSRKAPSTRRCIKTRIGDAQRPEIPPESAPHPEGALRRTVDEDDVVVVDGPGSISALEGALRPHDVPSRVIPQRRSESTQHHKVH